MTPSLFDTPFGILHSFHLLQTECQRIVSQARCIVSNVASGLRSGELEQEKAIEMLLSIDSELAKLVK